MNKQVLSPFDCDMCAMIEDITKQEIEVTASDTSIRLSWAQNGSDGNDTPEAQRIEALKQAIRGRLVDRFIEFFYADGIQSVYMKYDPEEYPEEMRTRLVDPDATAGTRYCRTLLEVEAMEMFTRASAHRDDFHEFRTADYEKKRNNILSRQKQEPAASCKGCPFTEICPDVKMKRQPEPERKTEYKKPEAHDVPKEVQAMAAFFADMFPGSEIQIQRVDLKKNPRNKRRAKNQRKNRKGGKQ